MAKEGVFVYREEFGAEGFQGRGGCSHGLARVFCALSLFSLFGHAVTAKNFRAVKSPSSAEGKSDDDDSDDDDALEILIKICVHKRGSTSSKLFCLCMAAEIRA